MGRLLCLGTGLRRPSSTGDLLSQGESDSVLGYLLTYGGAVVGGVFGAWAGEKANDLVWNFTYEQVRG